MKRILLVEDEPILGDTILISLSKMGYEASWVKTLRESQEILEKESFDLVLLDWNLQDGEGITLLKHRKRGSTMVLMLSSKSSVEERVRGLNLGADDYLPKPFSFYELEARIEALLRRAVKKKEASPLWKLDLEQMTVSAPVGEVELTPLEFKFLAYLYDRKDTIVSKDRLLRDVWGFSFLPKTRTVDYLMTQLRKKLEPDPEKPQHLLTIRGAGVKLIP